jgi:tetratricopeptide (TPR) repeat protein
MQNRILFPLLLLFVLSTIAYDSFAQPIWTINLLDSTKRSQKYEDRKLTSEKTDETKFTIPKHILQNNLTHYNFFYNANNKINTIVEIAKAAQKDNYTKLLNYYSFSLDNTASQKTDIDSVIYKATAGILLHDLRNDWIDNMYLLLGEAYYYGKIFDSAAATFQFINYNLFPRKKGEDDNHIVGTNDASADGVLSIANKEDPNIFQKIASVPPSRNDALVWIIRTLIEQGEMAQAASLINTLQHDPNMPKRLKPALAEVNGYWFYKLAIYDSAAVNLEKGLSNAATKQDQARSEYLLGQLYEKSHEYEKAVDFYNSSSKHTTDQLMDIYAQLNIAKMMKNADDTTELKKSIVNLVKMANKDRFEPYRDIIYYSAGELSLSKPDTNSAITYYQKSISYNVSNISFYNKAYLKLADIAYDRKQYKAAFAYYDSLQTGDTSLSDRLEEIQARRTSLSKIVEKIIIIEREDSLQNLALMSPADRTVFIKQVLKKMRKAQGLKEEETDLGSGSIGFDDKKNENTDLFMGSNSKDWYFDNATMKQKGLAEFKKNWGTRTNTDNWRRKNATITAPKEYGVATPPDMNGGDTDAAPANPAQKNQLSPVNIDGKTTPPPTELSFDALLENVPLTPEKLAQSHAILSINLFELAKLYQNDLEDYQQAIATYDESLQRYPDSLYDGGIYLGLYYCYKKLGNLQKAEYYKNLLNTKFAGSQANKILTNPQALNPGMKNAEGTRRYEAIYDLFIEGKFEDAVNEKQKADSLYGVNYWSPQLLYIEAVYYIKQRQDSAAIVILNNIKSLYPASQLTPKAERMIDVLRRRAEIEKYLTALQVTRKADDEITPAPKEKLVRNDSNLIVTPKRFDSSKAVTPVMMPGAKDITKAPAIVPIAKDTVKMEAPVIAPVAKDAAVTVAPVTLPVVMDTVKKPVPIIVSGDFAFNVAVPQNVMMVLNKVDGTYVNESKNAFNRYVSEKFRGQPIVVTKDAIDKDNSILIFASFENADAAMQFLNKVKKAAPEEVSWLPAAKYSFLIISDDNLRVLRTNKNLQQYKELLNKQYPGKF